MFEWRQAKRGGRFLSLSGTLLLAAALALCAVQAAAAEEAVPNPKTAPCKGLKPYNNIDELLYQFYINIDSDCLFKMPIEELEKIWDTKILVPVDLEGRFHRTYDASEFRNKPYRTERDGFYITALRGGRPGYNQFWIRLTSEYGPKSGGLYASGEYPKFLPKPDWPIFDATFFYNADRTREIMLITPSTNVGLGGVSEIIIYNYIAHDYDQ